MFWTGKFVTNYECNGKQKQVGWNNIFRYHFAPFIPRIDVWPPYENGKPSWIIDYTSNFTEECPEFKNYVRKNWDSLEVRRRQLGKYLNKTYL